MIPAGNRFMSGERILVVEDDKDLSKLLKYNLEKGGYKVSTANNGELGLTLFQKDKPDLVILDVMLPKLDGFEFCRLVRKESKAPIIMLTAKIEEVDRVLGLELGADDYVTKPFSIRELLARVKAILRRVNEKTDEKSIVRAGNMEVDLERYTLAVQGKPVKLSSKEFEFIKCLVLAKGKVLTRDQLLEKIWGYDEAMNIDTRTVDQRSEERRVGKE